MPERKKRAKPDPLETLIEDLLERTVERASDDDLRRELYRRERARREALPSVVVISAPRDPSDLGPFFASLPT